MSSTHDITREWSCLEDDDLLAKYHQAKAAFVQLSHSPSSFSEDQACYIRTGYPILQRMVIDRWKQKVFDVSTGYYVDCVAIAKLQREIQEFRK